MTGWRVGDAAAVALGSITGVTVGITVYMATGERWLGIPAAAVFATVLILFLLRDLEDGGR